MAVKWPQQNLDLNAFEMLWHKVIQVVYAQNPDKVTELRNKLNSHLKFYFTS